MKQLKYTLLIMLAALMLLPAGGGKLPKRRKT